MAELNTEQELNELLNESYDHAHHRVTTHLAFSEGDSLILYGAGNLGMTVLAKLREAGLQPAAFADDTPEKQGQVIAGLPVMAPQQAASRFGAKTVFVVTILNPMLRFLEARRRLQQLTGARVISFLELAWKYPQNFLPYYQFELPQQVLAKRDEIRPAFYQFADEESRRQFVGHLRFRLHLDYEALPENSRANYFPADVLPALPPDTVFVDCGAYDGDTIRHFLEQQRGHFREIFAFEPDEKNCQRLRDYVATLGDERAERIHIYHAAVGSNRGRMSFQSTGNMSAAFSRDGNADVEVLPLREIVTDHQATVYLKYDVEGAEREALKGSEELITHAQPVLAVSVYHKPDDLWQLPLFIKSLNPNYKLFLRTQGEDGMDAICFAVPPSYE
jgi:FkbM family methyltransferase